MQSLLNKILRWFLPEAKTDSHFVDSLSPQGHVEIRLCHAHGPLKGEVAHVYAGRNVVTGFMDNGSGLSGRDVMRRLLIPPGFGLDVDDTYKVSAIALGSGNAAETSADTELETPIATSRKAISSVELDEDNTYVTFVVEYDEDEFNQSLAEVGLYNDSGHFSGGGDFMARKTFSAFTKTNEFTMQVRWTIRF